VKFWPVCKGLAVSGAELSERAEALPVVIATKSKTEKTMKTDFLVDMATLPG
jgi:hypothetical protein